MNTPNSLYSLIKKLSQQKGVIRPMKSSAIYGISNKNISYKKYHQISWEKRNYDSPTGVQESDKKGKLIEKNKDFEKYRKERDELRKNIRDNEEYKRKTAELEKKILESNKM